MLPGNVVSAWQYDAIGRATSHRVGSGSRDTRRRSYKWDVNQRLKEITNELTNTKTTFYYNQFAELVRADYGFGEMMYRRSDEVGNIYESDDRSDRIYGKGSRLGESGVNTNESKNQFQGGYGKLVTKGTEYRYDGEGNLSRKVEPSGDTWRYKYYGNGMLAKVIKPDGVEVTFKYDSLGRRVEKSSDSKVIKFVWDGNNPLHEWEESPEVKRSDSLVTWVFEDDFVPSVKLTNQGNYSIITDHLGTAVEAYDSDGKKVWEQELDIYGRVKPKPVVKKYGQVVDDGMFDEHFIPFRYQGQYADEETGLYYNRYRYYSPELGQYISQDPIGLAGGNPTLYGYVGNPNSQIDPFGLICTHRAADPKSLHAAIKAKWGDVFDNKQLKEIMKEVQKTIDRIRLNQPRYDNDGTRYHNSYLHKGHEPGDQILDSGTGNQYTEWTVKTPNVGGNGEIRIVINVQTGQAFFTLDHYHSFIEIDLSGW